MPHRKGGIEAVCLALTGYSQPYQIAVLRAYLASLETIVEVQNTAKLLGAWLCDPVNTERN
jgi:hypothetical protein